MDSGRENKTACVISISAFGIPHQLQAATLPCLPASMCLIPSSCLSWRWNVNHAPKLGLCPKGKIQLDCPDSSFSMYKSVLSLYTLDCISLLLRPSDFFAIQFRALLRQLMQPSSTCSCHSSFCRHHSHFPWSVLRK